ncbi:hypothetical protein PLICRDRAFT_174753 [Plicaturopsis crispa FD-325 SS-3]|nr:hypothetical protein PLICRDRAFT_174753 [Plicaturopsis crispa FD-325 SS-3]
MAASAAHYEPMYNLRLSFPTSPCKGLHRGRNSTIFRAKLGADNADVVLKFWQNSKITSTEAVALEKEANMYETQLITRAVQN